jgi:ParB family chromosome partitioning protein
MKPTTSKEVPPWEKIPLAKEIPMTKITSIFPSPLKPRPSLIRELADSMERLGLLISVLARPMRGGNFQLVAGRHRFWAAQQLGWTTIRATAWKMTRLAAELVMINSNLCVAPLSPAERMLAEIEREALINARK